jgi:hypothetical protein
MLIQVGRQEFTEPSRFHVRMRDRQGGLMNALHIRSGYLAIIPIAAPVAALQPTWHGSSSLSF